MWQPWGPAALVLLRERTGHLVAGPRTSLGAGEQDIPFLASSQPTRAHGQEAGPRRPLSGQAPPNGQSCSRALLGGRGRETSQGVRPCPTARAGAGSEARPSGRRGGGTPASPKVAGTPPRPVTPLSTPAVTIQACPLRPMGATLAKANRRGCHRAGLVHSDFCRRCRQWRPWATSTPPEARWPRYENSGGRGRHRRARGMWYVVNVAPEGEHGPPAGVCFLHKHTHGGQEAQGSHPT